MANTLKHSFQELDIKKRNEKKERMKEWKKERERWRVRERRRKKKKQQPSLSLNAALIRENYVLQTNKSIS